MSCRSANAWADLRLRQISNKRNSIKIVPFVWELRCHMQTQNRYTKTQTNTSTYTTTLLGRRLIKQNYILGRIPVYPFPWKFQSWRKHMYQHISLLIINANQTLSAKKHAKRHCHVQVNVQVWQVFSWCSVKLLLESCLKIVYHLSI